MLRMKAMKRINSQINNKGIIKRLVKLDYEGLGSTEIEYETL